MNLLKAGRKFNMTTGYVSCLRCGRRYHYDNSHIIGNPISTKIKYLKECKCGARITITHNNFIITEIGCSIEHRIGYRTCYGGVIPYWLDAINIQ